MGSQNQKGFTVIEVILFLAVTALLLGGMLAGVNTSINQQRYKDSVNSFVSLIQSQYNLSSNVNSQRNSQWTCGSAAPTISTTADNYRGTTDCIIIGRLVQVASGTQISTSNIVAYDINQEVLEAATTDIEALTGAGAKIISLKQADTAGDNSDARELGWDSRIKLVGTADGSDDSFTLAIIRSPVSGMISSYVVNEVTDDWNGKIITQASKDRSLQACITSPVPLAGAQQTVIVAPRAANASGVYQRAGVEGC